MFTKFIKFSKEKTTELISFFLMAILVLGGTLGKDYVQEYVKNKEWSAHEIKQDINRYQNVQNALFELRIKTGADRACVYFFHNGGFFSNGIPYKKFSMVYESVNRGFGTDLNDSQNLPLSQLSEILAELINSNETSYTLVKDMNDTNWKYLMTARGVDTVYKRRINLGQKVVGFVELDFHSEEKFDPKIKDLTDHYGNEIQAFLEFKE